MVGGSPGGGINRREGFVGGLGFLELWGALAGEGFPFLVAHGRYVYAAACCLGRFLGGCVVVQGEGHVLVLLLDLAAHGHGLGGDLRGQQPCLGNDHLAVFDAPGVFRLLQGELYDQAGIGYTSAKDFLELAVSVPKGGGGTVRR